MTGPRSRRASKHVIVPIVSAEPEPGFVNVIYDEPPPKPLPWSERPPEKPKPSVSEHSHQDAYLDWCARNGVEPEKDTMIVKATVKKPTFEDC